MSVFKKLGTQKGSRMYTNSNINVIHHYEHYSSDCKLTWRRIYGDMIHISINSNPQYFCSPLDWNSYIEVDIEKNGTHLQKIIYGPVQLEPKLSDTLKISGYSVRVSFNQNQSSLQRINLPANSHCLFELSIGEDIINFPREFMMRRGWDKLNCIPQSGILIFDMKNHDKWWKQIIKKYNHAIDSIKVIFQDRAHRDQFLVQIIQETNDIRNNKQKNNQITETTEPRLSNSGKKNLQDSIIQILDFEHKGVDSNTMKDMYDVLYTPKNSFVGPSKNITNVKSKQKFIINYENLQNEVSRQQYEIITNSVNLLPRCKSKAQLLDKNPQDRDVEVDYLLQNPRKIMYLLRRNERLQQENIRLKKQLTLINKNKIKENQAAQILELRSMIQKMAEKILILQQKSSQQQLKSSSNKKVTQELTDSVPEFLKKGSFKNVSLRTIKKPSFLQGQSNPSKAVMSQTPKQLRSPEKMSFYMQEENKMRSPSKFRSWKNKNKISFHKGSI